MKIVIAPDSFKGSVNASEVADSIEKGIKKVKEDVIIDKIPMADGGEGTVDTLVDAMQGEIVKTKVLDPLGKEIDSYFGIVNQDTAVIEMALASGLPLVEEKMRNPLVTTTYGTGELIKKALDKGCRKFIIGIGGSATNDGGVGMASALGVKFLDEFGESVAFGGGSLNKITTIDISEIDERIKDCEFKIACDVDNPLCGEKGASNVFGPQKGATEEMVKVLDNNLKHLSEIIKKDLKKDIKDIKGSGAAGGLGAGLMAFCDAKLEKGIDLILEATNFEKRVLDANLVITGEGQIDFQTAYGKTPMGVASIAKDYNIPVVAFAGSIGKKADTLYEKGIDVIMPIAHKPLSLEECMKNGKVLIEGAASRLMRIINLKMR